VRHAVVVSRLFAPEPAAAAFRLEALARALAEAGSDVTVLTSRARPGSPPADDAALSSTRGVDDDGKHGARVPGESDRTPRPGRVRVRRARVLRDSSGYVRGYLPYLSFDVPVALRLLAVRRPDVVVVEPPPTTGAVVRLVCALRRVPYVYYAADVWSDATRGSGQPGLVSRVLARVEEPVDHPHAVTSACHTAASRSRLAGLLTSSSHTRRSVRPRRRSTTSVR